MFIVIDFYIQMEKLIYMLYWSPVRPVSSVRTTPGTHTSSGKARCGHSCYESLVFPASTSDDLVTRAAIGQAVQTIHNLQKRIYTAFQSLKSINSVLQQSFVERPWEFQTTAMAKECVMMDKIEMPCTRELVSKCSLRTSRLSIPFTEVNRC